MAEDKAAFEAELKAHKEQRLAIMEARKKQEKEAAKENKAPNKLVVEKAPTGLLTVYFSQGGVLPECLRTNFTSMQKLRAAVISKYGSEDILA
jgi:hypothetical protein